MDVERVLWRLAYKQTVDLGYQPDLRTGVENPILDSLYKSLRESGLEEALRAGQAMRDDERSRMENTSRANKPLKRTTAVTLWDSAARKVEGRR